MTSYSLYVNHCIIIRLLLKGFVPNPIVFNFHRLRFLGAATQRWRNLCCGRSCHVFFQLLSLFNLMSVAHWEPLLIFVAVMVPSLRGFLFGQDSPSLPIVMSRFCCHGALFRVIYSYVALFWVWSCVTSLFPCFSAWYGCLCAFSSTPVSRERWGAAVGGANNVLFPCVLIKSLDALTLHSHLPEATATRS